MISSKSAGRSNGHLKIGYQNWQKEEELRKIRILCESQFLYIRAIQGHSGDNATDPALQDNEK